MDVLGHKAGLENVDRDKVAQVIQSMTEVPSLLIPSHIFRAPFFL